MRYRDRAYYRIAGAAVMALLLIGFVALARPVTLRAATAVTMQNVAFTPATLTVTVGTTVTWTNQDTVPHTTTSDTAGIWDSGILNKAGSFSFTFTKMGTFAYHCNVHPNMHGTITVTPAATATATLRPTKTLPPPTPTTPPTVTPVSHTATPTIAATVTATTTATVTPTVTASPGTPAAAAPASSPDTAPNPPQLGPVSALPSANCLEPIPSFPDTGDHRYFATTGHSLNFGFKAYWEQNGGIAQFGYPISEEFLERGADGLVRTVQYFERARFEYHLDLTTIPYGVELGMLGREMAAGRENQPPFVPMGVDASSGDQQFFAATGHTLGGPFAAYWQANGGLAHFGYPISDEFQETGADGVSRTVQYFERYRFEYHADTNSVELSRLGVQGAQSRGYIPRG